MKICTTPIWTLLHSEPGASGTGSAEPGGGDVINPPSEPTPGEEVDFEALSKEFETDLSEDIIDPPADPEPSAPAAQPPAPAQPAATQPPAQSGPASSAQPGATSPPAAPSAATPPAPAAAPQPQAPAAQPQPSPTEPAPQPQAPTAPQPVTAEAIEAAYQQYQANILPQLERHYQMTPEQLTELEENPGVAIPKLLARVHMQSQIAAYTGVMSQMPRVVGMVMERYREVQKAEQAFFDRWSLLKDPKHQQIVDSTLKTFRAANPNMPTSEMIEKAGLMIMLSLGLDPNPQQPTQPTQPAAPAVPPMRPSGVGAPAPSVNTRGGNIFEQMAEEMMNDGS